MTPEGFNNQTETQNQNDSFSFWDLFNSLSDRIEEVAKNSTELANNFWNEVQDAIDTHSSNIEEVINTTKEELSECRADCERSNKDSSDWLASNFNRASQYASEAIDMWSDQISKASQTVEDITSDVTETYNNNKAEQTSAERGSAMYDEDYAEDNYYSEHSEQAPTETSNNTDELVEQAQDVANDTWEAISDLWDSISSTFSTFTDSISDTAKQAKETVEDVTSEVTETYDNYKAEETASESGSAMYDEDYAEDDYYSEHSEQAPIETSDFTDDNKSEKENPIKQDTETIKQSKYPEWYDIKQDLLNNINNVESNSMGQKTLWTWEKEDWTKEKILLWYRETSDFVSWDMKKTYYIELNNSWTWSDTKIDVSWDLVDDNWKIDTKLLEKTLKDLKAKQD